MSSPLHLALTTTVLGFMFSVNPVTTRAQQKAVTTDQTKIIDTASTIFTAARVDDVAKFDSVIASDFYIYDGGVRFDGDSVMAGIKAQHAAGLHYDWNVTEPDVHISGKTAWIAYVNKGSITDASGTTVSQNWLESAFLRKQAGVWKIVFMHSTRVPDDDSRESWQMRSKRRTIICSPPNGIYTLVLAGAVDRSPAVNLDYRLIVVQDRCADPDAELHAMLLDIVIVKQAAVVTTAELAGALPGIS